MCMPHVHVHVLVRICMYIQTLYTMTCSLSVCVCVSVCVQKFEKHGVLGQIQQAVADSHYTIGESTLTEMQSVLVEET